MSRGYSGVFFAAVLVVYALTLTCAHYWDGVLFALDIERVYSGINSTAALIHPNHLLYSVIGYWCYVPLAPTGIRAITTLALLNCICGAIAAALVFSETLSQTRSRLLASAAACLFAFGATWWKFSTDAAAYVPAVLLVMLAVRSARRGRATEAAFYHSAGMLVHEISILAVVPIAASLYWSRPGRRRIAVLAYALLCTIVVSGVYVACFRFAEPQQTFLNWLTSFSSATKVTTGPGQLLVSYPLSYAKLLVGGKLSLLRQFLSWPSILSLILCATLLIAAAALLRKPRAAQSEVQVSKHVKASLLLWILPYAAFLAWFEPGNAFYKLFLWPALVLLASAIVAESRRWRSHTAALLSFAGAIGAWNFAAFIYPHAQPASDPVYALALRMNREMPAKATIFYDVFSPDDWYLAYFAPGRTWRPAPKKISSPACLESTALSRTPIEHPRQEWILNDGKHNVRVACF